jgi:tRNA(Arg) A34 adenosine deaminase TadA
MKLAIETCRVGIEAGQTPFGCVIARGDQVLAAAHNTVLQTTDITAHAELNAIREACRAANDIFLDSAVVATTCEPCPMCMAALHWARVAVVYYGATIQDAQAAGFNELELPAETLARMGNSNVKLVGSLMAEECRQLFQLWKAQPGARAY